MEKHDYEASWRGRLHQTRERPIRRRNVVDDGFFSWMANGARFTGTWEMPAIEACSSTKIPLGAVPFSQLKKRLPGDCIVFFENDPLFADALLGADKFLASLREAGCCATPDCSVYRDMPFAIQPANIYLSRLWGSYVQSQGIASLIPTCRWGDERTYEPYLTDEPVAFVGLPKKSMYWVGTYGLCQNRENRRHLEAGLAAMIEYLQPRTILVYGSMPHSVFDPHLHKCRFVLYPDWVTRCHSGIRREASRGLDAVLTQGAEETNRG